MQANKKDVLNRLATIEGHLKGIRKSHYALTTLPRAQAGARAGLLGGTGASHSAGAAVDRLQNPQNSPTTSRQLPIAQAITWSPE